MAKKKLLLKVLKRGSQWVIKSSHVINGWTLDDSRENKGKAIDAAFRYARQRRPAMVRIFDAKGRMQKEIEWGNEGRAWVNV